MSLSLDASLASDIADLVTAAVDAGSGAGTIKVYSGSKPASTATSPSGTLLATFTLADPAAAAAAAGVASWDFSPTISATIAASGTAGWFRVADSTGAAVFDGTVGTSGADMNFPSTAWVSGGTVELASGGVTHPQT